MHTHHSSCRQTALLLPCLLCLLLPPLLLEIRYPCQFLGAIASVGVKLAASSTSCGAHNVDDGFNMKLLLLILLSLCQLLHLRLKLCEPVGQVHTTLEVSNPRKLDIALNYLLIKVWL